MELLCVPATLAPFSPALPLLACHLHTLPCISWWLCRALSQPGGEGAATQASGYLGGWLCERVIACVFVCVCPGCTHTGMLFAHTTHVPVCIGVYKVQCVHRCAGVLCTHFMHVCRVCVCMTSVTSSSTYRSCSGV